MQALLSRSPFVLLAIGVFCLILAALVVLQGDPSRITGRTVDLDNYGPPKLDFRIVTYADLPGWRRDDHAEALDAFLRSCDAIEPLDDELPANRLEAPGQFVQEVSLSGAIADWREPCREARKIAARRDDHENARRASARIFFESNFQPIQIFEQRTPGDESRARKPMIRDGGLFTGYYEPLFPASRTPTKEFSAPVLTRPNDLVEVDLGAFREEFAGQRVAGRVAGGRLVPYANHREINDGALYGETEPLAYMDPNDLFFLQIQGSGQLRINDDVLRVGYAAQNGHPYTAIGKVMYEQGLMPLSAISMQSIREWLERAGPRAAKEMREENASYVFFSKLELGGANVGPLGAQGVSLTARRSLAVDRRFYPMGAPVWVDIDPINNEFAGDGRLQRLMIAQDTGGAIRGPIRGDVFWGAGQGAGEIAGKMRSEGRMFLLTPRSVARRLEATGRS